MAVITGTEQSETLTETAAGDAIDALGGDDTVVFDQAGSATEFADGGAGSDRLVIDMRNVAGGGGNLSQSVAGVGGRVINLANFEHFSFYRNASRLLGDNITTGAGDDLYSYAAANDATFHPSRNGFVDLGGGLNDTIIVDATAVTSWSVDTVVATNMPPGWMIFRIAGSPRIEYTNVEHLELIGSPNADSVLGLGDSDILDGRDGNDVLSGLDGNDRLVGGNGNDTLDGGEGDDTLVFSTGTDTAAGGNGTDRLEIDARGVAGAVAFSLGTGPVYAGSIADAGGTATYSGIENFTVYSNPGNYADDVATGDGDDVFHHEGINDLFYLMDEVDLGGGSNDLLVADFSAVTDYAVTNGVHPSSAGHYLFNVGGNGKIDYTGVERIHFIGGAQGDTVTGLAGDDILDGRAGNDSLTGGDGNDDIAGGTGTNAIDGGDGDDVVRSVSFAIDTVAGGPGNDVSVIDYSGQTAAVTNISGGTTAFGNGSDSSVTTIGVETFIITTGSGNDDITTSLFGNDQIRTGAGTDTIHSGFGNDYLDGGSGADAMSGGLGDDVYIVDDSGDAITEASGEGTDTVYASVAAYTLSANVENLIATGGAAHNLRGNGGDNNITGEAGNDFLFLQDGGTDAASGRSGNDVFLFGATLTSADSADGGAGTDQLAIQGDYSGAGALTLGGGIIGIESFAILPGNDIRFGDPGTNFYDYDITTVDANVAAGIQVIVDANRLRAGEDFTFNGSAESDGGFFVWGGGGVDTLTGGAMTDVFYFGENGQWGASDVVNGGGGTDQLGFRGNYTIVFGAGQIVGIENIGLVSAQDTRFGALGSTFNYNLTMNDANLASGVQMTVDGAALRGGETLTFDGSAENDGSFRVFGGQGDDSIVTGAGNDIIQANAGADTLTGGAGADLFRYLAVGDSIAASMDQILDFTPGTDKIDLSRIDANTLAAGDQAFSWIGSAAFTGGGAGAAGELRAVLSNGHWLVEGDTNGDGTADFVIDVATPAAAPLGAGDFLL
jgi:Ca2+-binding RTX toxin-like protein